MPRVPQVDPESIANPQGLLSGETPGSSQVLMAAAGMHGMGRLLDSGKGVHTDSIGVRMPKRSKGFSQRGRRG